VKNDHPLPMSHQAKVYVVVYSCREIVVWDDPVARDAANKVAATSRFDWLHYCDTTLRYRYLRSTMSRT